MNRLLLAIMTIIIVGALMLSDNVRNSFNREYTPVDSVIRHGIPLSITGGKYPSLEIQIIDDPSMDIIGISLPHKLYSTKDTLSLTIYKNYKGERLRSKINNND